MLYFLLVSFLFQAPPPLRLPSSSFSTTAYELGSKLVTDTPGAITAIRYWKIAGDPGPLVGHLWSASGMTLAEVAFTNETASGWQQQLLPTPVAFTPSASIVVSVNNPAGAHFAVQAGTVASVTPRGDHVTTRAPGGASGATGAFPTVTSANDYFRDVIFVADVPTATIVLTSPVDGSAAPGSLAVQGLVSGIVPGPYTVTVSVSDAGGHVSTSTAHVIVDEFPIKAGDLVRSWAYTFVTAQGETLPSQRGSTPNVIVGGPFYAQIGAIQPGPLGTIARQLYQTTAGGSQLQFVARLNDNTTTTYAVHLLDTGLGGNAPTVDTSGIRPPGGAPSVGTGPRVEGVAPR